MDDSTYEDLDLGRSAGVSLGVDVLLVDGEVQTEVTWSHLTEEPASGDVVDYLDPETGYIKVFWGRKSCQAHHSLPKCHLNNPEFFTNDTISPNVNTTNSPVLYY